MIIICRIVWAKTYGSAKEKFNAGKMNYPRIAGETAGELLNFVNDDGYAYGYVEPSGASISLKKLGVRGANFLMGVDVIWAAVHPISGRLCVVGWYRNATIHSTPQTPKRGLKRKSQPYQFKAKFNEVCLLPETERFLNVPTKRTRDQKGYIGQRNWFFPEGSPNYKEFLADMHFLMSGTISKLKKTTKDDEEYLEGERYSIEMRLVSRNSKLVESVKRQKGTRCEVCHFDFEERYGAIGKGFIEAHHLVPLATRKEKVSSIDDLAVLCANCHRMIHKRALPYSLDELKRMLK